MDEGTKPASLPPSLASAVSVVRSLPFPSNSSNGESEGEPARSFDRPRTAPKEEERANLIEIHLSGAAAAADAAAARARSWPAVRPPARRCHRRCRRRFGKQKESRVGRFGPQRSQSPSPSSLSRPSCPKGTRLTHSPRRDGDGGSNFWMDGGREEGDLLWRAMAMARRVLLLK